MRLLSVLLRGTLPLEPVWYFCSYELLESPNRGRKKKRKSVKRETKTYPWLHCKYRSPLLSTVANVKQWHV